MNTPEDFEKPHQLPRHSDSSQTWSSENDSSDVEDPERNQYPQSTQVQDEDQGL